MQPSESGEEWVISRVHVQGGAGAIAMMEVRRLPRTVVRTVVRVRKEPPRATVYLANAQY